MVMIKSSAATSARLTRIVQVRILYENQGCQANFAGGDFDCFMLDILPDRPYKLHK